MDSSQLTRLRQEAANQYLATSKTVDSSLLTFKKHQLAAYAGAARINTPAYFNGSPTVNPILYDKGSCPINHSFTSGYTNTTKLSQQESRALEKGGRMFYISTNATTAPPPGIILLSQSTCSTILTSYNNNTPKPGQCKPHSENHYFPKPDKNSQSTCCVANKYPYPSG